MGIRDDLLPVVNELRAIPGSADFQLRRFAVTIRRRVWSGLQQGEGLATDYDIAISPAPRVRDATATNLTPSESEFLSANRGTVAGQLYKVDKITPRYTNTDGSVGGYLAEQIRLWPNRDTGAVDNMVALVGDDGYLRECEQVLFSIDRAFGYSMLVKETDRPRTPLVSIAITPAAQSIAPSEKLPMLVTGSFNGGATSQLTTLSTWQTSDPTIAMVDIYGVVTGVGAGTATISAGVLSVNGSTTVIVS